MNETEQDKKTAGLGAEMPAGPEQSATDAGQGAGMHASLDQSATDAAQGAGIATDAGQGAGMPASLDQSATDAGQRENVTATHVVDLRPPIRPDTSISDEAARLDALLARLFSHKVKMQEGSEVKIITVADLSAPVRIGMIYEHIYNFATGQFYFSDEVLEHVLTTPVFNAIKELHATGGTFSFDEEDFKTTPYQQSEQLELGLVFPGEEIEEKPKPLKKSSSGKSKVETTKLSQGIEQLERDLEGGVMVRMGKRGVRVPVKINSAIIDDIKISTPIDLFSVMVENAIGRLYEKGHRRITSRMVYIEITASYGRTSPISESILNEIDRVTAMLAGSIMEIDYTKHYQMKFPKKKNQKRYMLRYIIKAEPDIEEYENDKGELVKKTEWLLTDIPLLYSYANEIEQFCLMPYEIWEIPGFYITRERMMLIHILSLQLPRMSRKGGASINIDTIFEKMMIEMTRDKKFDIVNDIKKILDYWKSIKDKTGLADYEVRKEGKSIKGITMYKTGKLLN